MVTILISLVACQSEDSTSDTTETDGELKLLTYNIHGLPPAITNDDTTHRIEQIAPRLMDYDLVGIQEDWMDENHDILKAESGFSYTDRFDTPKDDSKVYGSGLTWLSTLEMSDITHHYYASCYGTLDNASDCLASKGIQEAHILLGGTKVMILNTHLEAGNGEEDQSIRGEQIADLQAFSSSVPTILLGDFNLHPEDSEHRDLLAKLEDAGFEHTCWNQDCSEPNHIDQIWIRSNDEIEFTVRSWSRPESFIDNEGVPLSDHPPIEVLLQWHLLNEN